MSQPDKRIRDVAREVIAEMSPDDLVDFDFVADAYAASPAAARRARRPGNEPTGSIADSGGEILTTLVLAVATDVCKDMLIGAARNARDSAARRLRTLFPSKRVTIDSTAPPITSDDVARMAREAVALALANGADAETAAAVGAAVAEAWSRKA